MATHFPLTIDQVRQASADISEIAQHAEELARVLSAGYGEFDHYGPYVTDGETNASVPKGTDPGTLTLDAANDLLEARRSAAPRPGRGRATSVRRKKTAAPVAKKKAAKTASASKPKTRKVAVPS